MNMDEVYKTDRTIMSAKCETGMCARQSGVTMLDWGEQMIAEQMTLK